MQPHIIGDHPLAKGDDGKLKSRIATAFPYGNTIVTLPGIHATQRLAYVDALARQRAEHGLPPLTREEETVEWHNSVDLIIEDDGTGVPDNAKEKIFRREYFKNTGLGLFLTREILAITNLTITEQVTFGKGARFVIHAPKGTCRPASGILTDNSSTA